MESLPDTKCQGWTLYIFQWKFSRLRTMNGWKSTIICGLSGRVCMCTDDAVCVCMCGWFWLQLKCCRITYPSNVYLGIYSYQRFYGKIQQKFLGQSYIPGFVIYVVKIPSRFFFCVRVKVCKWRWRSDGKNIIYPICKYLSETVWFKHSQNLLICI